MFIHVTRPGAVRTLPLRVGAIAYLDAAIYGGAAIHLVGGDVLAVTESPAEIEAMCEPPRVISAVQVGDRRIEFADELPTAPSPMAAEASSEPPPTDAPPPAPAPASIRKGRR